MGQRPRKGAPNPIQVKSLREESGHSQSYIANLLDVDISALQRWESGQTSMPGAAWNYYKIRVLRAFEQKWVNENGLRLHRQSNSWLKSEYDQVNSDLIKGIIFAALYERFDQFSDESWFKRAVDEHTHLEFIVSASYEPNRAELLVGLAHESLIVRGFFLGRLIQMEVNDV